MRMKRNKRIKEYTFSRHLSCDCLVELLNFEFLRTQDQRAGVCVVIESSLPGLKWILVMPYSEYDFPETHLVLKISLELRDNLTKKTRHITLSLVFERYKDICFPRKFHLNVNDVNLILRLQSTCW